ncbi:hypothetical protein Hanom_Chr12g01071811 [Helianthus anomalus]
MHDATMDLLLFSLFLILNCYSTTADYPTVNLSTTWANTESLPQAIVLRGSFGPKFACGFYCNGTCTSGLFSVFIVKTSSACDIILPCSRFPPVVWSANLRPSG